MNNLNRSQAYRHQPRVPSQLLCSYEEAIKQVAQLFEGLANPATNSANPEIDLRLGDFRTLAEGVSPNSVDLILTDPPYGSQYRHLWADAARVASRILKPGGFFVSYSGQYGLPEVMGQLCEHLNYFWLGSVLHRVPARRDEIRVINAAKPILIFYKPPRNLPAAVFRDVIVGSGPDKSLHGWQQPEDEASELIRTFSQPGQLVVDLFAGTSTNLVAARTEQRRAIGFEIDPVNFAKGQKRLLN